MKLPFGWSEVRKQEARNNLLLWIVGALLSIAGIGLGAPFWFDLLRRIAPSSVTQSGPRPATPAAPAVVAAAAVAAVPVEALPGPAATDR
jgi:hypothetical protein